MLLSAGASMDASIPVDVSAAPESSPPVAAVLLLPEPHATATSDSPSAAAAEMDQWIADMLIPLLERMAEMGRQFGSDCKPVLGSPRSARMNGAEEVTPSRTTDC
jgi:hypothetical protein